MFSWALPSGELGGLPGEFYQFANSIRSELSAVSVRPLKETAYEPQRESRVRHGNRPPGRECGSARTSFLAAGRTAPTHGPSDRTVARDERE